LLERLFALETFGIKLGLENIARLCAALGHPERAFATLHVAGTNGKGSVAAMAHAALGAAGLHAARYTSPHLNDITERFVIGRRPVAADALDAAVGTVLDCAASLQRRGELRASPTFFEAATAAAFVLFRDARVDTAVIEVGMGGRFDATNVIDPVAGAITTIGLDHQQYLGDTLEAIAFEKAGIIKPSMTVVTGALPAGALAVIIDVAAQRGARVIGAADGAQVVSEMADGVARVTITTPRGSYGPVSLGLRGLHQVTNALVAVRLLEAAEDGGVRIPPGAIVEGLARPDWPARLELFTLPGGARVLLDAAHNVDGAAALAGYLEAWHPERPLLVLGVMHDKDIDAMLRVLLPAVSAVITTAAPTPRAMAPDALAARVSAVAAATGGAAGAAGGPMPVDVVADPEHAVREALARAGSVCVAGSIFLAGAVREGLRQRAILR
jgi:dihydrofolate synthase/folylpolyglutamate synthase